MPRPHPHAPPPGGSPSDTAAPPARRRRRGERGLTTLEWLLIVAAVAGLAALAVVLVQNVVDDTAEQISAGSARLTAAKVAAQQITDDAASLTITEAQAEDTSTQPQRDKRNDLKARCERLRITYGNELKPGDDGADWTDSNGTAGTARCTVTGKDETP